MAEKKVANPANVFRPLLALSSQSVVYGGGIFVRQLITYLSIPLFTQNMPRQEYGVIAVISSLLVFFNVLTNAGVPAATFRLYNDSEDHEHRRFILGSGLQLSAGFAFLASLVIALFSAEISVLMLASPLYAAEFRIVAVQLFIESLVLYGAILLRIQVRPLAAVQQGAFHIVVQMAFASLFVIKMKMGALGYFYGFTAGSLAGLVYMIWLTRDILVFKVSRTHIVEMLKYGLPLLPGTLALWAINMSDRTILSRMVGLDATAVYAVGYKIGLMAGFSMLPIKAAWPQFSFSIINKPNAKEVYKNSLTFFILLFVFSALCIITFQKPLVALLAPAGYKDAVKVIVWVALSQVAWGAYSALSLGLHIAKKPHYISGIAVVAALANILSNFLLIPVMGIVGAAVATLIGYSVLSILSYALGQQFYAFPVDGKRLCKIALAGGTSLAALYWVEQIRWIQWVDILWHAFGLLLFPFFLLATRFTSKEQMFTLWETGAMMLKKSFAKKKSGEASDLENIDGRL